MDSASAATRGQDSPPDGVQPETTSSAQPNARKRPLRTYGKRSAQSREPESAPPSKKQRLEDVRAENEGTTEPRRQPLQAPRPQPPPKRGSIMSYFKPVPPRSSSPATPSSAPAKTIITPPPSSPIPFSKARKRRRLTTRPTIVVEGCSALGSGLVTPTTEDDAGHEHAGYESPSPDRNRDDAPLPPTDTDGQPGVLADTPPHTLNSLGAPSTAVQKPGNQSQRKKAGKRSVKDLVQTTLSLSTNPGPGFTICNECGVLYNPLNEKDRKDHKRQHAAHVRRKARKVTAAGSLESVVTNESELVDG